MSGQCRTLPWTVRLGALTAVAVSVAGLVCGCGAAEPSTRTTPPAPVTAPEPTLHPEGTAEDNLPYFTAVVDHVWAGPAKAQSLAYVDALTNAGFDRAGMQMTADATTIGNPAESIQFSVRWGETTCLVGQVGPSTGTPVTAVLPQLSGGRCLIGATPDMGGDE